MFLFIVNISFLVKIFDTNKLFNEKTEITEDDLVWENVIKKGRLIEIFLFKSRNNSSNIIVSIESTQIQLYSINYMDTNYKPIYTSYCQFPLFKSPIRCVCNLNSNNYLMLHLLYENYLDTWILPDIDLDLTFQIKYDQNWFNKQPLLLNRYSFEKINGITYSITNFPIKFDNSYLEANRFLNNQIIWLINDKIYIKIIETVNLPLYTTKGMIDWEENLGETLFVNTSMNYYLLELDIFNPLSNDCQEKIYSQFNQLKDSIFHLDSIISTNSVQKLQKQISNYNCLLSLLLLQGQQWLEFNKINIDDIYHINQSQIKLVQEINEMKSFIIKLSSLLSMSSLWFVQLKVDLLQLNQDNLQNNLYSENLLNDIVKSLQSLSVCIKISPLTTITKLNYLLKNYHSQELIDETTNLEALENILLILNNLFELRNLHESFNLNNLGLLVSITLDIFKAIKYLLNNNNIDDNNKVNLLSILLKY